ncbi:MAG: hypothetical protein ACK41P_02965 [Asticcacaulis sp.]
MFTVDTITQRVEPISPQTPGGQVYERFQKEPDTLVIPVVESGIAVGIVERNAFFLHMAAEYGRALYARRPISVLMNRHPVTVERATPVTAFCDEMLKQKGGGASGWLHCHARRWL